MMNIAIGTSLGSSNIGAAQPSSLSFLSSANRLPSATAAENPGSVLKPVEGVSEVPAANSATNTDLQVLNQKQQQLQRLEARQQQLDQRQIQELAARDREVRNHERAHAAVGGQYAGAPRYQFERGPDGINYAVGGEVSISTGGVSGDPQATIEKAQLVRRAALAPAEPSSQDRKVAAQASQMEAEARVELANIQREERLAASSSAIDEGANEMAVGNDSSEASASVSPSPVSVDTNGTTQINANNNSSDGRQGQQQNPFSVLSENLNRLITSSNANGQYNEPGQLINQIA